MQNLYNFSYIGNQRNKETNGNTTYHYEANGNISSDALSGLQISYNLLNLPSKIYGWGDYSDYYRYLADGTKILHEYSDGQQDRYIGSLVYYSNGEFSAPIGGGRKYDRGALLPDRSSWQYARGCEGDVGGPRRPRSQGLLSFRQGMEAARTADVGQSVYVLGKGAAACRSRLDETARLRRTVLRSRRRDFLAAGPAVGKLLSRRAIQLLRGKSGKICR